MSWAADDWTAGLTGRVLQKVRELQAQQERLGRERQQKQLQLDNAEAALHKYKLKNEEVQRELTAVQRELTGVRERAQGEVCARERLTQELQARQAQVFSLEGQLEAAHTLTTNLTKEIKRLEAELEKLHRGNSSGDSMLFSTPCWNMASPWEHNSSKLDERVSRRGEGEGRLAHVRQQLQFCDSPRSVSAGAPSPFPQQPHKATPARRSARNPDASTPSSSMFPWERDDTSSVPRGRAASSVAPSSEVTAGGLEAHGDCGMLEDFRKERDAQSQRIQELQSWVQSLERDLRAEAERSRESDTRLGEAKRELAGREQSLVRSKDELGRAHTLIGQERDRAQASEQRAKQLQEELKCQRQNAETSRTNAEHKRKEMEREHQRELLELQKERQALERLHQQESLKLNQEIQQARTLHNTLQSQHDKLALQKQAVERELDSVKGTLKNTESELKDSQKRETQTQAKLTEALRDGESLTVTIEQLKKKERSLEEEVKRLSEELADALRRLKELQDQPPAAAAVVSAGAPSSRCSSCGGGFSPVVSYDRPSPLQPQTQRKKALKVDRAKEQANQRAKYPSDREPGEGIDSEQMEEFGSERPPGAEGDRDRKGKAGWRDENAQRKDEAGKGLSPALEEDSSCDEGEADQLCPKTQVTGALSSTSPECSRNKSPTPLSTPHSPSRSGAQPDLKRENMVLRDELRDAKQELERRLEDLEKQRRAEAEARTKLKQLSRKHSTQAEQLRHKAQEQQEEKQKLEKQLEEERRESGRLKEALAVVEGREEESRRERDEEAAGENRECKRLRDALSEMERKGREMEEESGQLKRDLEVLRVELSQEREERGKGQQEVEKEEEKQEHQGSGGKEELMKVAALEAEVEELRKAQRENLQLKYLPLDRNCDDNKAMDFYDEDIIPSPMDHVSFCQAVNLHNTMVSHEVSTKDFITDPGACKKQLEHSRSAKEACSVSLAQQVAFLRAECDSLRRERDGEAGKAKLAQNRLEVLQKQVTSQTQQLTQAFESQSSHIEGLLVELQHREDALHRQGEELRLCQEEMTEVRAAKEKLELELMSGSSGDAKEVSHHSNDATEAKHQPDERCNPMEKNEAKTLDGKTEDASSASTLSEPQVKAPQVVLSQEREEQGKGQQEEEELEHQGSGMNVDLMSKVAALEAEVEALRNAQREAEKSSEQLKEGAQSPTSSVPSQVGEVQDGTLTDVQSGSSDSQQCEITASGNTESFVEVSGSSDAKGSSHTEATVQESGGVEPVKAGERRDEGAAASASEQMGLSHNASLQPNTADVLARDVSAVASPLEDQSEVDQLRAHNAQLVQKLKEASLEELQYVRLENEQLMSRLKLLEVTSVHIQGATNPNGEASRTDGQGELSIKDPQGANQEEHAPSVQPEGTALLEDSVGRGRTEEEPPVDETLVQSMPLEHQLQSLISEVQRLTEDNQRQAEELELWRMASQEPSALLPGAMAGCHGDGDSITLVREDHILLSCGASKLGAQLLETRSLIHHHHQGDEGEGDSASVTSQPGHRFSLVPGQAHAGCDAATVKSRESDDGDLAREVSSCSAVETKVPQNSFDDLRPKPPSAEPAGQSTEEEVCQLLAKTKTVVKQADTSDRLPGPDTAGVDAKADSLLNTATQALSSAEAFDCATTPSDAGNLVPDAALTQTTSPKTQTALAAGVKVGVESVRLNDPNPTETHQNCTDTNTAQEQRRQPDACEVKGQSLEVTSVERVQVGRELKSAATQTTDENAPPQQQRAVVLDASTQTYVGEEEEEEEDEVTDSPCPSPEAAAESERLLLTSSFPIPADPVHLAERIRRNRSRMSAAYDDTEYEPYGLPEVVMKGFADIPSGPACPYVLRRGLLGTSALPLPVREEENDVDP